MPDLKHVGRYVNNGRRVAVAYRVVPNDPDYCLVIPTENLSSDEHDSLIKTIESAAGQEAYELAEAMHRSQLPDGRNMLLGFVQTGKLRKELTADIEMVPNTRTNINLAELNQLIAEQKGVTVADLALEGPTKAETPEEIIEATPETTAETYTTASTTQSAPENGVLSDEDLAKQLRSQADAMFKEAKALREQAEELVPTKKTRTKKAETST